MADTGEVTLRHPETLQTVTVAEAAVPFFTNQGYEVLTSDGRVNTRATAAANKEK